MDSKQNKNKTKHSRFIIEISKDILCPFSLLHILSLKSSPNKSLWPLFSQFWQNIMRYFSRFELRRSVRARTRVMYGRTCACLCKIHSGKCAGCVCVRPFFGRAMCDHVLHTFAHFLGQNCQKMLHFRTFFPALECLSCFWSSYSVLEHTKP